MQRRSTKGRGSPITPAGRFQKIVREDDLEHFQNTEDDETRPIPTDFIPDHSKTIVTTNESPDLDFRYTLNPYRGCEHGCAYCYARPTHEYLDQSAGLDFETKIFVKQRAPELFRDWLCRSRWKPEPICFSGVTDCYQPAERRFRLTRGCLEVALEARQPITIVTKNALITRDLDILSQMASLGIVLVSMSVNTLDENLARTMEPRTSTPSARLRTIGLLHDAGVPTRVMVAPVIPGLNDSDIPSVLKAAQRAGARFAAYILLRLPLTVRPIFSDWLSRTQPTRKTRVESLVRSTRDGQWNDSKFGSRMCGNGPLAAQIRDTFHVFCRKYGLNTQAPDLVTTQFRPPRAASGQLSLF